MGLRTATTVLLACLAGYQEDSAQRVPELVRRLDSDAIGERDAAQAEIVRMGRRVRPQLLSSLPKCAPEARARVEAVLQGFILLDEEEYALKQLALETPWPATARRGFGYDAGEGISSVLSRIAGDYGIKVETFPGDQGLAREADHRKVPNTLRMSRASARSAIEATIVDLEAFPVVEGDRVILLRITPTVLFEGLRRAPPARSFATDLDRLRYGEDYWDRPSNRFRSFLQNRLRSDGDTRRRWLGVLKAAVLDPAADLETRRLAVQGCRSGYLIREEPQPDSTDFLVEISAKEALPVEIRREALFALACCPEAGAARKVLEALEGNDEPLQAKLLLRLLDVTANPSVFVEFRRDAAQNERLLRALRRLARSENPAFRWRAASLLSNGFALGREVTQEEVALAVEALVSAPEPADSEGQDLFFGLLRRAIRGGSPEVRKRVQAMARHESAQVRASAALMYGHSAGGKERRRDVADSLGLLGDRDPLVRGAAADSLRTIYTSSASEPYTEAWAETRNALHQALERESDPISRRAILAALKERD